MSENVTPMTAIALRPPVPSPNSFVVLNVAALVKKYPIEAPIAAISTNQPRASRPRIGPDREMMMQNSIAFLGVLYFSSITPNHSGR